MHGNKQIKIYKNPERKKPDEQQRPYVPQYKIMGLEPSPSNPNISSQEFHTGVSNVVVAATDNPRLPRPLIRQPYAEAVPSPVGRGQGQLPNVGNNVEQSWLSVDQEIVDDISDNRQMIDNNEYMTDAAFELPTERDIPIQSPNKFVNQQKMQNLIKEEELLSIIGDVNDNDYILLVRGEAICSGSLEDVQEQTRDLIFGEHPLCQEESIPVEHITVLKKVAINIGVFLS